MDRKSQRLKPFAIYCSAWVALALVYLGQNVGRRYYVGDDRPWQDAWYLLINFSLSAACTPVILHLGRRWPLERPSWRTNLAAHFVFSLLFGLVRAFLAAVIYQLFPALYAPLPVMRFGAELAAQLVYGSQNSIIAYWLVIGVQSALQNYTRYQERAREAMRLELNAAQLRTQITHAKLSALKAQLQPHFLFNTLNAIMVLVRQQNVRLAEATLERFSDLLRAVLADSDAQEVPLARELAYARLYLSLEQLRFSDRLNVRVDVDPELLDAAVPHMSLQPILENAIRHGIEKKRTAGHIVLSATRVGDELYVSVEDDGPGFGAPDGPGARGIGLSNTRARLMQLYGGAADLRAETAPGGGAIVTLVVPHHLICEDLAHELERTELSDERADS
jgi:two-component system LytT family sensor kinase